MPKCTSSTQKSHQNATAQREKINQKSNFPIYFQVFRLNFFFSHTPSILFSCKRHLSSTQHNLFCVFRPRSIYRTIFRIFCFFFSFDCFSLCSAVLWKKKQKKNFFSVGKPVWIIENLHSNGNCEHPARDHPPRKEQIKCENFCSICCSNWQFPLGLTPAVVWR